MNLKILGRKIIGKVTDAVVAGVIKVPKIVEVILKGGRAAGWWKKSPGPDDIFRDGLR